MKRSFIWTLVMGFFFCASVAAAPIELTDMVGRTVVLPGPAQRIITGFQPATLCLNALGLADRIVGIDNHSTDVPLNLAVRPEIARLPQVGNRALGLNLETISALQPDLAVLFAQKDGRHLADRLARLNIPSVIIFPEDFPSLYQTLRLLGRAAGVEANAERAVAAMQHLLDVTARYVRQLPPDRRKRGYYGGPEDFFSTVSGTMLQTEMLARAGIHSVSVHLKGHFQDVSAEQLILWRPEVIVVNPGCAAQARQVLAEPQFAGIPAVQRKAVFTFPSPSAPWDFPSPLCAAGVLWLSAAAYPRLYDDLDPASEIDRFHQILFNRTLTQIEGARQGVE